MTHRDLLALCYCSEGGEIVSIDPDDDSVMATVWGPWMSNGRPLEVRVTIFKGYKGAWTWVGPDGPGEPRRPWWSQVYSEAQQWLLGLNWVPLNPKAPLMLLADDENPFV
jgi:hypothetical protein